MLSKSESYLWPSAVSQNRVIEINESEIVRTYPHRNAVPQELWDQLLAQTEETVDILVYVGMFLTEKPQLPTALRKKAGNGVKIRMLFGDRGSAAVIQRSTDEGIGPNTISAKIDHALAYFRSMCTGRQPRTLLHCTSDDSQPEACSQPTLTATRQCGSRRHRTPGEGAAVPKRDYYNDASAPKANSIVPAVTAVVENDNGELLMIERADNELWALPGGAQDLGESVISAVQREVNEETGIDIEVTGLSGIYSDPRHVIAYDDGEVRQEFSLCFRARPVGGSPRPSSETRRVSWVPVDQIDSMEIHPSMRLRITHALERRQVPYLG
jgi:8-oxo-dGTP pyrophosphatase MutT (NUDIX family)